MIRIDRNNIPEYMKECIIDNPNKAGIVIDENNFMHFVDKVYESHILTSDGKILNFNKDLIFISEDF